MKVLVPVDVLSASDMAAAVDAILDRAWPADVEFHLLNVIEDEFPGGPCAQPGCELVCRCLEARVRLLSDLMRQLEIKMHGVPIYIEVAKGNLQDKLQSSAEELDGAEIFTPKPVRSHKFAAEHPIAATTLAITAVGAIIAIALAVCTAFPAGGFVPIMPPPSVQAPVVAAPKAVIVPTKRPSDDQLRMEVMAILGDACVDADDYAGAVVYYQKALKYLQNTPGAGSKLSSITGGLSIAYFGLNQTANALNYAQRSIDAALATEPRDYKDISVAYNNCAYINKKAGKLQQAEEMYERAVWYAPSKHFEDRVRAATIEVNLADVYGTNGKMDEARATYHHALAVMKREMPANNPVIRELQAKIRFAEKYNKVKLSKYPMMLMFIGE